ncbi:MAG: hypothetical protein ABSF61_10755 [Anaerolineales bacterium]
MRYFLVARDLCRRCQTPAERAQVQLGLQVIERKAIRIAYVPPAQGDEAARRVCQAFDDAELAMTIPGAKLTKEHWQRLAQAASRVKGAE